MVEGWHSPGIEVSGRARTRQADSQLGVSRPQQIMD